MIDILLDNAQKCCIKVLNSGTPIPEDESKNIFQRFYRTDKARSCDGSFGLGLSIAENIVHMHKEVTFIPF